MKKQSIVEIMKEAVKKEKKSKYKQDVYYEYICKGCNNKTYYKILKCGLCDSEMFKRIQKPTDVSYKPDKDDDHA